MGCEQEITLGNFCIGVVAQCMWQVHYQSAMEELLDQRRTPPLLPLIHHLAPIIALQVPLTHRPVQVTRQHHLIIHQAVRNTALLPHPAILRLHRVIILLLVQVIARLLQRTVRLARLIVLLVRLTLQRTKTRIRNKFISFTTVNLVELFMKKCSELVNYFPFFTALSKYT